MSRHKIGKFILTFVVRELPVLTHVEFRGLKHLKLKEVEEKMKKEIEAAQAETAKQIEAAEQAGQ